MKVPDKIFSQWVDLKSHGDGKKIAETSGITEMDVSRAFANQECSDKVFEAIGDFYKEKLQLVKEYMPSKIDSVK